MQDLPLECRKFFEGKEWVWATLYDAANRNVMEIGREKERRQRTLERVCQERDALRVRVVKLEREISKFYSGE